MYAKAFARLYGGWSRLRGNNSPAFSLKAMTGCTGEQLLIFSRRDERCVRGWECFTPRFDSFTAHVKAKAAWPDEEERPGQVCHLIAIGMSSLAIELSLTALLWSSDCF